MTAQARPLRAALALTTVAAIWVVVLMIVARIPVVAPAAAFDLTCTAGAAMYFMAVRRGHLPRWTLTLTVAAGVMASRFLLHGGGALALAALGTLELAAMMLVAIRLRRARRAWRGARENGDDALEHALAATGMPPVVGHAIATELRVMRNALVGWRTPRRSANVFTSHRTNGWSLIAGTLIALTLVETPLVHIVLARFGHETLAWVATCASLYSVAWFIGDLHALRHGGIVITNSALELHLGVRWRGTVPRAAIASVARCTDAPSKGVDFSILGANVLVTLREPVELRGLFGRRRRVEMLALSVDEPDRFEAMVSQPDP